MSDVKGSDTTIIIKNVRLAFPDVREAVQFQGTGPFNYKATFLVPPGSDADKAILAAIEKGGRVLLGAGDRDRAAVDRPEPEEPGGHWATRDNEPNSRTDPEGHRDWQRDRDAQREEGKW